MHQSSKADLSRHFLDKSLRVMVMNGMKCTSYPQEAQQVTF
jgi:hypothetical protein